jgi:CRISPR/Cas system-associated exonuclease Cas4 (RecB family)
MKVNLKKLIEGGVPTTASVFLHDLEKGIEKHAKQDKRTPSKYFKPSSMNCNRNMFYTLYGCEVEEDKAEASMIGIRQSGTDRHARIQHDIRYTDWEFVNVRDYVDKFKENLPYPIEIVSDQGAETHCRIEEINLSFMADGIVKDPLGKLHILEIKTEMGVKWSRRADIAFEHINQGVCYAMAFGLSTVIYLYENRDNLKKKAYLLQVSQQFKDVIVKKALTVIDNFKTGKLPDKEVNKYACQYCPYTQRCREDG